MWRRSGIWLALMLAALPLTACGADPAPEDPQDVWEAFINAMNTHDLEAAMSFVADDAEFDTVFGDAAGEEGIRAFLTGFFDQGAQTELLDVRVEGEVVSATEQVTSADGDPLFTLDGEVTVRDGKITSYSVFFPCNPMLEDCD